MLLCTYTKYNTASIGKGLALLKYVAPTPIQAQTWPIALDGKDMVGIAETGKQYHYQHIHLYVYLFVLLGSGKTMAFLLPALVRYHEMKAQGKISASKTGIVVMAPTRELAQQINEVACKVRVFGVVV